MTLANLLTVLRIVLIPVFVVMLLQHRPGWAAVTFGLAAATDFLDGFVARRTRVTSLGRFLDPMADKLMLVSAYAVLAFEGALPVWVAVTVVSRDVIISLGYLALYLQSGNAPITVRPLGKLTTLLQSLGVAYVLLAALAPALAPAAPALLAAVGAVTVASGLDYMILGMRRADELDEHR